MNSTKLYTVLSRMTRLLSKDVQRCLHLSRTMNESAVPEQPTPEEQVAEQQKRNEEAGQMTELVRDFLDPAEFYKLLRGIGVDFFCGVPDSLLKDFCAYVTSNTPKENHVITANEGSAVGLAAGYHMATGKTALVYMQINNSDGKRVFPIVRKNKTNFSASFGVEKFASILFTKINQQNSGLGNTVNPIMSLAVPSVYSIPMLMLIGWRGEPGKRDEPQHRVQGQATPGLLAALGIPFQILPDYLEGADQSVQSAKHYMDLSKGPFAFLVKRQTFLPYKLKKEKTLDFPLTRESALKIIVDGLDNRDVVVSTTGMLSRELYEYRVQKKMGHEKDFLTVGSMGHASSIALGIALSKPKRQVFCLDGDGAAIMHMGNMATIGQGGPANFKHILINNGAHDSVGGQPTDAANHTEFSFGAVVLGCGYKEALLAVNEEEVAVAVSKMKSMKGPVFLEIKVSKGGRKDLGRPTRTPLENKHDFMHFLAIN